MFRNLYVDFAFFVFYKWRNTSQKFWRNTNTILPVMVDNFSRVNTICITNQQLSFASITVRIVKLSWNNCNQSKKKKKKHQNYSCWIKQKAYTVHFITWTSWEKKKPITPPEKTSKWSTQTTQLSFIVCKVIAVGTYNLCFFFLF